MRSLSILLTLFIAMMLTACTGGKEGKFVGCYALEDGGRAELKITKDGGKFFASIREGGGWSDPEGLHSGTTEELRPLFGDDSERIKANLIGDVGFGIFLVEPGEVYGGEKAKTEYIAFVFVGGGSVYKVRCE